MTEKSKLAGLFQSILGFDVERYSTIPKASILAGDTKQIETIVARVVQDLHNQHDLRLWHIVTSGYESDKRHLAQIPEVREWCFKVHAKIPYLPFLMTDPTWYLLCVLNAKPIENKASGQVTSFFIDPKTLNGLAEELPRWLGQILKDYQLSQNEFNIVMEKGCLRVLNMLNKQKVSTK